MEINQKIRPFGSHSCIVTGILFLPGGRELYYAHPVEKTRGRKGGNRWFEHNSDGGWRVWMPYPCPEPLANIDFLNGFNPLNLMSRGKLIEDSFSINSFSILVIQEARGIIDGLTEADPVVEIIGRDMNTMGRFTLLVNGKQKKFYRIELLAETVTLEEASFWGGRR